MVDRKQQVGARGPCRRGATAQANPLSVAVHNDDTNLYLYPGEGRRAQSGTPRAVIGWGWTGLTPFALTDWDHDGPTDIVVRADTAAGPLWLYPGQGRRGASTIAPVWAGGGW